MCLRFVFLLITRVAAGLRLARREKARNIAEILILWGSITGSGLTRLAGWDHPWVIFSTVYLLVRSLLGCLMVLARREVSKDADGTVALRHPWQGQGMITSILRGSDGSCEVVEGDAEPVVARDVGGDVVVATAQILHERVAGGEDPRRPVPFQAPHRPEPGFQPPVIGLDWVVRVLLHGMQRRGDQIVEDPRVNGCAVGGDLGRDGAGAQRSAEEVPRGRQVALRGHQCVDDLARPPVPRRPGRTVHSAGTSGPRPRSPPAEPEASKDRGRARRSHKTSLQPPTIGQRNSAPSGASVAHAPLSAISECPHVRLGVSAFWWPSWPGSPGEALGGGFGRLVAGSDAADSWRVFWPGGVRRCFR